MTLLFDRFRRTIAPIQPGENFRESSIPGAVEIKEGRIFSKQEILDIIEKVARAENIDSKYLTIDYIQYDKQGNIIDLQVKINTKYAEAEGWGNSWYLFNIKGKFGPGHFAEVSLVARLYGTKASPNSYEEAGIVAEYKEGAWALMPGTIAERGTIFALPKE